MKDCTRKLDFSFEKTPLPFHYIVKFVLGLKIKVFIQKEFFI